MHGDDIEWDPEVLDALSTDSPVVALESTAIAHGLPYPDNLQCALAMQRAVREHGAIPAVIGVLAGRIRIGLDPQQLERFASTPATPKASSRDLAVLIGTGGDGATTVAGTVVCAALAGISMFATGGLGGVHREAESSFDISADLTELGRSPVAVVCSGAKSILDLPKTLERLETEGVPVIGYRTDRFPAFYARDSGLGVSMRLDRVDEVASVARAMRRIGRAAVVVANPIPRAASLEPEALETWMERALDEAKAGQIRGKALTPFLLGRLHALSEGRTLAANRALLIDNASVAAEIAAALAS